MLYQIIPVATLIATAFAAPTAESKCSQAICIDDDLRQPLLPPITPPCATTIATPGYPVSSTSIDDCSTRTVCADYVNECGVWYGGCFADCHPWPTFNPPPCPSSYTVQLPGTLTTSTVQLPGTSTTTTVQLPGTLTSSSLPIITVVPSQTDCHTQTVCADYINECGQTYGGCFSACTPWPTFTPPPCPTPTEICADYLKTCTGAFTTLVMTYGGCFDVSGPTPTFTEPDCPVETATP